MGDRNSQPPQATYASSATSQAGTNPSTAKSAEVLTKIDQRFSNLSLRPRPERPFDNVPISGYLYLLTPYLNAPPLDLVDDQKAMDPFEPFGRHLAGYHAYIKHTPYVASHGLTKVHKQELKNAAGLIVVVCQPPKVDHLSSSQRLDGLSDQQKFAKAVSVYLKEKLGRKISGVLICIDADCKQYGFDERWGVETFSKLNNVAQVIFGTS